MTQEEQQRQEEQYLLARQAHNKEFLRDHYETILSGEKIKPTEKRYAEDMLESLDADPERKKEINDFWNAIQTEREVFDNKIEYLHSVVEHLRDIVIEVSDPDIPLLKKMKLVKDVASKNFISNISLK